MSKTGYYKPPVFESPKAPEVPKLKKLHVGPIHSHVAGRTDHLPMTVPSGSYVLPADVVSGLGESNTLNGFKNAKLMFGGLPYKGSSLPYGRDEGSLPYSRASGGKVDEGVPIVAAGGEYVVTPHEVIAVGDGDKELGHRVLDEFVKRMRAKTIKTLKHLPGPKSN